MPDFYLFSLCFLVALLFADNLILRMTPRDPVTGKFVKVIK